MIYLLAYALFCIALAWDNARIIKKDIVPMHWLNGIIHIASAGVAWLIYKDWKISLCVLIMARLVFDTSLALWRGLPFDYVALNPKSLADKIEKAIFGMNGWLPKLIYLAALVVLIII